MMWAWLCIIPETTRAVGVGSTESGLAVVLKSFRPFVLGIAIGRGFFNVAPEVLVHFERVKRTW